jgi:hypothetical protein
MAISVSIKDIYDKRNTSAYAKSGFSSGIVAGLLYGITATTVLVLNKGKVLIQLDELVKTMGAAMPLKAQALYTLALWVSGPATILLYSLLGIIFGLICEKYNLLSPLKIMILSVLVGLALGMVTHLPLPPIFIITSSVCAWGIFGIIFSLLTQTTNRKS